MTPAPDYLRAECRAAARRLARLVREEVAKDPEFHDVPPLEGTLFAYLRCICNAERASGTRSHVVMGALLRHAFERHARHLEAVDRVTIEPGRVALRRPGDLDEWRDVKPGESP
jgi:hypothetical protein